MQGSSIEAAKSSPKNYYGNEKTANLPRKTPVGSYKISNYKMSDSRWYELQSCLLSKINFSNHNSFESEKLNITKVCYGLGQ